MTTTVVHCKKEKYDVYIGRPGPLGNEFIIGRDGSRTEVIAKKKATILSNPTLIKYIISTCKDKRLGCFCHPLPCHGDIYVELCDEQEHTRDSST